MLLNTYYKWLENAFWINLKGQEVMFDEEERKL